MTSARDIVNPAAQCFTDLVTCHRPAWFVPAIRTGRELAKIDTRTPELKELTR